MSSFRIIQRLAFRRLVEASQRWNCKLREVAEEVRSHGCAAGSARAQAGLALWSGALLPEGNDDVAFGRHLGRLPVTLSTISLRPSSHCWSFGSLHIERRTS